MIHTAIATVLVGILVAGTCVDGLQRQAQHFNQGVRILRQQLVQVTRAARHRVIKQHILPFWRAVFARFFLCRQAQVIHPAAKTFLQAKLQRRHERLGDFLIHAGLGVGHQNTQRFGLELAIQIKAIDDAVSLIGITLQAIESVLLLVGLCAIPGPESFTCNLYLAAMFAELESRPHDILVCDTEFVTLWLRHLAEIHIAESSAGNELKTKRQVVGLDLPSLPDRLAFKIDQQLADINLRLAIFRAVVDAHIHIVAIGNGLAKAQQQAFL